MTNWVVVHLRRLSVQVYNAVKTDYGPMGYDEAKAIADDLNADAVSSGSTDRWIVVVDFEIE